MESYGANIMMQENRSSQKCTSARACGRQYDGFVNFFGKVALANQKYYPRETRVTNQKGFYDTLSDNGYTSVPRRP